MNMVGGRNAENTYVKQRRQIKRIECTAKTNRTNTRKQSATQEKQRQSRTLNPCQAWHFTDSDPTGCARSAKYTNGVAFVSGDTC